MNKYIHKLIKEQFSISDLDFSDDEQEYSANIFNKDINNHPYYYKVLNCTITYNEIKELNSMVSVAIPTKKELKKIIKFYSNNYPEYSLNWLNVSGITSMYALFKKTNYNGDISKWNTSNVTNMSSMFEYAEKFN